MNMKNYTHNSCAFFDTSSACCEVVRSSRKSIMPESQHVEYKSTWRDEYLKWICGFANASGGILYIGIDDYGTVAGIISLLSSEVLLSYPLRAFIRIEYVPSL